MIYINYPVGVNNLNRKGKPDDTENLVSHS